MEMKMHFVMADNEGSVLDTFENAADARASLRMLVSRDPSWADELLVLPYNDDGSLAGDAVMYRDIAPTVQTITTVVISNVAIRSEVYPVGTATSAASPKTGRQRWLASPRTA